MASRLKVLLGTASSRRMSTLSAVPQPQQLQQWQPKKYTSQPPSRLVLLTLTPPTLTPADVYQLLPDLSRRIHSVRILRAENLTPRCSALVSFDAGPGSDALRNNSNFIQSTSDCAKDWAARVTGRSLGGCLLNAKLIPEDSVRPSHSDPVLRRLLDVEAGRLVLMHGFPLQLTAERLERMLWREYALLQGGRWPRRSGEPDLREAAKAIVPVDDPLYASASRSAFVVRLKTAGDAQRLARTWDRRIWNRGEMILEGDSGDGPRYTIDASVLY